MELFYLEIRAIHIGTVFLSGFLLLVRGLSYNLFGAAWVTSWPVRVLSYTIDTMLLTAALMLMTITDQYPFVDSWLTMKLLLVLLYIVLGYTALRGATAKVRWSSFAAAAVVFAFIVSIARAHHPLGAFA